jgi:hypothetical protein
MLICGIPPQSTIYFNRQNTALTILRGEPKGLGHPALPMNIGTNVGAQRN